MADIRPSALPVTATTPAADDYLLLDGTAEGTRKMLAAAGAIDVRRYGAVGDGVTNDSTAFANATTAALAAPVPVLLIPEGTFNVPTWTVSSGANLCVLGTGPESRLIGDGQTLFSVTGGRFCVEGIGAEGISQFVRAANTVNAIDLLKVLRCDVSASAGFIDTSSSSNAKIARFLAHWNKFDGLTSASAINVSSIWDVADIAHNEFFDLILGIRMGDNDDARWDQRFRTRVFDNEVRDVLRPTVTSTYGIIVYGQNVNINENRVVNVDGQPGADVEGIYTKSTRGTVSRNRVINGGGSEGAIVLKGGGSRGGDVLCSGNYIEFNRAQNVSASIGGLYTNNPRSKIENNIVRRVGTGSAEFLGIRLVASVKDIFVVGNKFFGIKDVSSAGGSEEVGSSKWYNNYFEFNDQGSPGSEKLNFSVRNCSHFEFVNNHMIGQGTRAIQILPGSGRLVQKAIFRGNHFEGFTNDNIWFRFDNNGDGTQFAEYVEITGNHFSRPAATAVDIEWVAPALLKIEGNTYTDLISDTLASFGLPTTDQTDGVTVWNDGGVLKVSSSA